MTWLPKIIVVTLIVQHILCHVGAYGHGDPMTDKVERGPPRRVGTVLYVRANFDDFDVGPIESGSFLQRVKRSLGMETGENTKPIVESLMVTSRITSRFAQTSMRSSVLNPSARNREALFVVQIPDTAFMSNFTMTIDDQVYVADVMSKKDAQKAYRDAQKANKTAGLVEQGPEQELYTPPDDVKAMETFKVSVSVRRNSSVQFELTYQELLVRRSGLYRHPISVRPNQIVDRLRIEVSIFEAQGIEFLDVVEPFAGTNSVTAINAAVYDIDDDGKQVVYEPSAEEQRQMDALTGINGDLVVVYDILHKKDAGLVQVDDGYFVHFFSPSGYTPLSKHIIFVIDISGSMAGEKIDQTREAILAIMDKLRPEDTFMMILFSSELKYWPDAQILLPAHQDNIFKAKQYVKANVKSGGGTNINSAMVTACEKLRSSSQLGAAMVVFLTDGQPSAGETNKNAIITNVARAANEQVSILSLGFGFDLDFELLQSISYRNNGFARRIYPGFDAGVQLKDFFLEVNTPLLYNIQIEYPTGAIDRDTVTKSRFAQYFNGTELVVSGKMKESAPTLWDVKIVGTTTEKVELTKQINSQSSIVVSGKDSVVYQAGFLEKLYVYMKIKDLLRQQLMTDDEEEKSDLEEYALRLSVKYNLVTPLTSFVIVQTEKQRSVKRKKNTGMRANVPTSLDMFAALSTSSRINIPCICLITLTAFVANVYSSLNL